MKLVNKILPALTTIGAVCSIPCTLTSCGGDNDGWTKYTYDPEHMDIYEYVTPVGGTLSTDSDTATKFYLEAINNNKKILADDIAYNQYSSCNQINDDYALLSAYIGEIDAEQSRINIILKIRDEGKTGTIQFNDFAICIHNQGGTATYAWAVGNYVSIDELKQDHDWSATLNYNGHILNWNWTATNLELEDFFNYYLPVLKFDSHYLSETAPLNPF